MLFGTREQAELHEGHVRCAYTSVAFNIEVLALHQ